MTVSGCQETPDDELFWNMNIVCPLIAIGMPAMEPYVDDLVEIAKLAQRMRCKKVFINVVVVVFLWW